MRQTLSWVLMLTLMISSLTPAAVAQQQNDTKVNTIPPTSTAQGTSKITPAQGTEGTGASYNFLPYSLPGQYPNPVTQQIENQPFDIAYASRRQPVQTSDWWTGIGLQWSNDQHTVGWVVGRSDTEGKAGRSRGFIAEPFTMSFVGYGADDVAGARAHAGKQAPRRTGQHRPRRALHARHAAVLPARQQHALVHAGHVDAA